MKIADKLADLRFLTEHRVSRSYIHYLDGRSKQFLRTDERLRRGEFRFRAERSIWIYGDHPSQFVAADEVIAGLKQAAPESCFVMLSEDPHTQAWLKRHYPNDQSFPAPRCHPIDTECFFEQLKPSLLIVLQSAHGVSPLLLRRAREHEVPVVLMDGRNGPRETVGSWARAVRHPAFSHYAVQSNQLAEALLHRGIEEEKITVVGNIGFEKAFLTPKSNPDYLKRELRLPTDARLILVDDLHPAEERGFLARFARLRALYPMAVLLWKPVAGRQLHRAEGLASKFGLVSGRWGTPGKETPPAVFFLDPTLSTAPFYPACAAVVAGGTFTPLPSLIPPAEPVTLHAPVIYGPYLPCHASSARALIESNAAFQCSPGELEAMLATFIESDPAELAAACTERSKTVLATSRNASQRTLKALLPHYPAPVNGAEPSGWRPPPPAHAASAVIPKIEIPDWTTFRKRLGSYRSILCLGNGPSSERPEIPTVPHDTLFRTNHRWMGRGILTNPQVVFVGSRETLHLLKGPIFILSEVMGRIGTLEDNHLEDRDPFEVFIPTTRNCDWLEKDMDDQVRSSNGALMIAMAAALQPEEITIAGIDLFSHPDGRYPGELQAVNAYSHCHERSHEIEVIEQALRSFRGRITILSPILIEALAQRQFPMERLAS